MSVDFAFYNYFEFHRAVLEPVYLLLKDQFRCIFTSHIDVIISSTPKIVVMTEQHYSALREALPEAIIVWLRHGFASKNNLRPSVIGCDFAAVNSDWVREQCILQAIRPRRDFWVTGFVPLDVVFAGPFTVPSELTERGFSRRRPTLLYAPTYNEKLNSVEILGNSWLAALHQAIPELNVIIKPHPVIPERNPNWVDLWRCMQQEYEHVYLIEEAHSSIYPYFRLADALLSDASSVAFYFLSVDRPILLVNNPRRVEESMYYDPDGPEWRWRDMAVEVTAADELPAAVRRCFENPHLGRDRRSYYAQRVLGELRDGLAARRVAAKLGALVAPVERERAWLQRA